MATPRFDIDLSERKILKYRKPDKTSYNDIEISHKKVTQKEINIKC